MNVDGLVEHSNYAFLEMLSNGDCIVYLKSVGDSDYHLVLLAMGHQRC